MEEKLICIIKNCIKCNRSLTLNKFRKNRTGKDGTLNTCKDCEKEYKKEYYAKNFDYISNFKKEWKIKNKKHVMQHAQEYYQNNKDIINTKNKLNYKNNKERRAIKAKEYRIKNKDKSSEHAKQYYNENKEILNQKKRNYNQSYVKFNATILSLIKQYEEVRQDPNNNELGQVKCTYCGKWYNPNVYSINRRLNAIKGTVKGECRLYCGDNCKNSCPIYKRVSRQKDYNNYEVHTREIEPLLRQMAMERDNYQCQKCFKDINEIQLHAHHILSYNQNMILANDIDNVIILCKDCHVDIHRQDGCKYNQLKCK